MRPPVGFADLVCAIVETGARDAVEARAIAVLLGIVPEGEPPPAARDDGGEIDGEDAPRPRVRDRRPRPRAGEPARRAPDDRPATAIADEALAVATLPPRAPRADRSVEAPAPA